MTSIGRLFDDRSPPFVIAEVAQTHDGSVGLAHAFIDAVAESGADAVKFQTHIADAESTPDEPFRIPFSYEDATRYEYWKRIEFSESQWHELKKHAEAKGLIFLSSPFSIEAAAMLQRLDICGWKVGSGEIDSNRLLKFLAATGKPILVSTGMASYSDVDNLISRLDDFASGRYVLMQCTSEYPTPPDKVGLNVMLEYMDRYSCPVGLSDHSGKIWPSIIAAWNGARVIEVHVTLSRSMFGPDVSSSITIEELTTLVDAVSFAHVMRRTPVDKDAIAAEKQAQRNIFGKSAVALRDICAGEEISHADVTFKKPGGGIGEPSFEKFVGRRLIRHIAKNRVIAEEDFA